MISRTAAKRIFEIYVDEIVTIYLRDMNVVSVNESQQEVKISPMIEGLLIDVDTEYIYLGLEDGSILRSIPHATVGLIELSTLMSMIDQEMPDVGDEVH
jgi:hypothetical protein